MQSFDYQAAAEAFADPNQRDRKVAREQLALVPSGRPWELFKDQAYRLLDEQARGGLVVTALAPGVPIATAQTLPPDVVEREQAREMKEAELVVEAQRRRSGRA